MVEISCSSTLFQVVYSKSIVDEFLHLSLRYELLSPFPEKLFFLMVPIVWRPILATEWYFLTGFLYERLATVLATKISSKPCFKKIEMYDFWTDKWFGTFM